MKYSIGFVLGFLIIGSIIGAICWPYTINTWLIFFHKQAAISWWQGSLIGFCPVIGQISIAAAIITWILMLFIR